MTSLRCLLSAAFEFYTLTPRCRLSGPMRAGATRHADSAATAANLRVGLFLVVVARGGAWNTLAVALAAQACKPGNAQVADRWRSGSSS